jgi:RNA polymerase sigma-70 factor (ECF subfamily)
MSLASLDQITVLQPLECELQLRSAIIARRIRMESSRGEVTVLLERMAEGDRSAEEELLPRVYVELHRIAMVRLRSERPGHTLQATALVHEVYLRMCNSDDITWRSRAHFFCVAARLMRRILVDYARQHGAQKRNEGIPLLPLEDAIAMTTDQSIETLEVDQVLQKLARISPRQAQVVEMKFFAGLHDEEIALALGNHVRTVRRDWYVARAWLHEQLKRN